MLVTYLIIGILMFVSLSHYTDQFVDAQTIERCDAGVCHVAITKDGFEPKTMIVKIGTTVVWTNNDEGRHTVTSGSPGEIITPLKSDLLGSEDNYEFTFQHSGLYEGSYKYFDQITLTMRGEIIVEQDTEAIEKEGAQLESLTIPIDFSDSDSGVTFSLEYGIVKSVEIDPGFNSLTVILENVQSGKLDITLHRELIDSKINGYDDTFVVLVDGEDALYDETSSTLTERILQVAIPSGASFIEIIGTETLTGIRNEGLVTLTYEDFVFKMPIFLSTGIVDRIDIDRHGARIVLSVSTSSTEDGELKLDLPRALLDSETDGTDKQFVIMVDGKRSDYQEDGKSRTFRTLTIKVPAGVDKVEIIGTKVVPESPRRANMQEFVDTLFKQCRAFLIQGNYEEALFYCREVLNSNPMHIEALFNTGAVLHELGRNEEVITYYDRLLQIDPNDVRVLNNKGITLCELGKCEEAIGYFDKVLVTEPYNVDALTGKGSALFSQGRVKEANALIENALEINRENVIALKIRGLILLPDSPKEAMVYFDQVLRKDPADASVHEYRGFALLELDRFVESTESFDTSLLVMPTNTCALLGKAESMIGREKFKEAIDYYDKALAMWSYDSSSSCFIDADDLQIIKAKSYAYFKLEDHNMLRDEGHKHFENEKYVKAIVHYKNFLKLEPNNIEVLNKKGIALILLEKYNLSLMTFDKTLELEPENADALGGKGFSLLALGKNEEANRHIVTALELEPENRFALIAQAISFKIEGKFEMAMIEVDKVLKFFPENPFLLLAKAELLVKLVDDNPDKYEEALSYYDRILAIEPNNLEAIVGKGNILSQQGEYDKALVAYEQALLLQPDNTNAHLGEVNILFELGQYDDVIKAIDMILKTNPENFLILNKKGEALMKLGRYEEAFSELERVLEFDPGNLKVLINKGDAAFAQEMYRQAVRAYDAALKVNPDHIDAMLGKAMALVKMERYEESIPYFDDVLELELKNINTTGGKWYTESEVGKKALKGKTEALTGLGSMLLLNGSWEEAKSEFDKALALNSEHGESKKGKGVAEREIAQATLFEYFRWLGGIGAAIGLGTLAFAKLRKKEKTK